MRDLLKIIVLLLTIVLFGCSGTKKVAEEVNEIGADKEKVVDDIESDPNFEVLKATKMFVVPGVHSNLRGTYTYDVVLKGIVEKGIVLKNILVDSIEMPIRYIEIDGVRFNNLDYSLSGSFESIRITTSRMIYDEVGVQGRHEIEPVEYPLSGIIVPKSELVLQFEKRNKLVNYSLGLVSKLDNLYQP